MHWENKRIMPCFFMMLTLLRWSGTEPTIPPRCACINQWMPSNNLPVFPLLLTLR